MEIFVGTPSCLKLMGQLFEQFSQATVFEVFFMFLGTFSLRMGNTFLSGFFRSVVGPVSHMGCPLMATLTKAARLKKLPRVSSSLHFEDSDR